MVLGCWRKLFTAAFSDIANQVPPERIICLWIYQWETLNHKSVSLLPSEPDVTEGVQMNWWVKVQSWLVSSDFAICSFPFLQYIERGKQACSARREKPQNPVLSTVTVWTATHFRVTDGCSQVSSWHPSHAQVPPDWAGPLHSARLSAHQEHIRVTSCLFPHDTTPLLLYSDTGELTICYRAGQVLQFGITLAIKSHEEIR